MKVSSRKVGHPRAVLAVFICAFLGATLAAPGQAAAAVGDCIPGVDWGTPRADLASQVVQLVNNHRVSLGRQPLKVSPTLTNAAVWKARHMAKYQYMQHSDPAPPAARSVADRLLACGYPANTSGWGENIAWGYATAAAVTQAWLNSPGHRANIENASFRTIGVGAATSATGLVFWAQEFGTFDDSGTTTPSPPSVSLTSGPASTTTSTSATFAWSTGGTVTSTTCSLDNAAPVACSSPRAYSGLAPGTHTFRVTVSNSAGSASAPYTWTVTTGTAAPSVSLTSAPPSSTTSTSASFAWSTGGTVTSMTCSLDNAAPVACSSPRAYSGLAPGTHTFRVTVSNSAGSASAPYTWTVTSGGTAAPSVSLTSAPPSSTTSTSASFGWSTAGTVTSTTCSLDNAAPVACTSPRAYSGLAPGTHTFRVTVSNSTGSASAPYTWTVTTSGGTPTTPPTMTLTTYPPTGTTSRTATFAWSTTGAGVTSACSLDGGPYAPCTSPATYSGLAPGFHRFRLQVSNAAGGVGQTYSWLIN